MASESQVQAKQATGNWNAIWSMTIGVAGLIIAEFLPAGVLTPMAVDLGISEGLAGQAVTMTSVFAVLTSLLIAYLTRNLNRRTVLLALSFLLGCSSLIVAAAPNFTLLLIGRVLLGISLGGFWSMATALTMRIVPQDQVPKALSIIFGGSSFATVLAAPLGSFVSGIMGWRSAFLFAAAVGFLAFAWQFAVLPRLNPKGNVRLGTTLDVLRTPQFAVGLMALFLVFCGRFASFTYLRPFLEKTTGLSVNWVSGVLLIFGVSYFVGNAFAPGMIRQNIHRALVIPPAALFVISLGLLVFGSSLPATFVLVFLWGASFGPVAPAWSTWVARKVPEHAETAGGLYVAAIQGSAAFGAMVGGIIYDQSGSAGVLGLSGLAWLLATILIARRISSRRMKAPAFNRPNFQPNPINAGGIHESAFH